MKFKLAKELYNANKPYLKNKNIVGWYSKMPQFIHTITTRQTI